MRRLFWIIWSIWLVLDVLTAIGLEIYTDEGYYWMWSQHLAWGYYDHPPMVALWVWLSSHLIPSGTLSVRLMTVLCHGLTLWGAGAIVKERLAERGVEWNNRSIGLFFLCAGSLVMFTAAGFLTTPDAPLMLFATAFFYALLHYDRASSTRSQWLWAIAIGLSLALMCYSKYMVVLVLLWSILAKPKRILDPKLWVSLILMALLMVPHILWQMQEQWPSVRFHLVARSDPFRWWYLSDYLPNQLLVFNPILLVLSCILAVQAFRKGDTYDRTMAWQILGFLVFFLLMTFRGHVEPHWTMVASVPVIVLSVEWLVTRDLNTRANKWLIGGLIALVGIIFLARGILVSNRLPIETGLGSKQIRYDSMEQLSDGRVVVLTGSFQRTAMYRWFEHKPAVLIHDLRFYRHTQFEKWHLEIPFQGQPACIMHTNYGDTIPLATEIFYRRLVNRLQTTDAVTATIDSLNLQEHHLTLTVTMSHPYSVPFEWNHDELPAKVRIVGLVDNEWEGVEATLEGPDTIPVGESVTYRIEAEAEWLQPQQKIAVAIDNGVIWTQNTPWVQIKNQKSKI